MFQPTSPYYSIVTVAITAPDGRVIAYKRRRFLPQSDTLATLAELTVAQGDRLDLITARLLSDPEQFWRIADANNAMDPLDLTSEPGRKLRVAVPQAEGALAVPGAETEERGR